MTQHAYSTAMTLADEVSPTTQSTDTVVNISNANAQSIRDSVAAALENYFSQLDGEEAVNVYEMVLSEMEAPLFEAVMKYTRKNQTKASIMLGLNRGTLRKKLKQYDML
jgi:Fis family transcriptional regulator